MNHVFILILCTIFCGACSQNRVTDGQMAWYRVPVDERTRAWAIAITDPVAQTTIDAFNAEPHAAELGGPFHLDQYARDVVGFKEYSSDYSSETDPEVLEYMVMYRLTVPVFFRGHPEHFSVFVHKADGSTTLMGGR